MKKLLISLMLLVPLMTGCANVDTKITINNDKSATVTSSLTYQGDLANLEDVNAVNITSLYNNFLDASYNVQNVYGAKLSTITATKSVKDLRYQDLDLSSLGFSTKLPSGNFIDVKKSFLLTSYNIDMVYNLPVKEKSVNLVDKLELNKVKASEGLQPEYYQKYGDLNELEPPTVKEDSIAANMDEDTKQFVKDSATEANNDEQVKEVIPFTSSLNIQLPAFASFNNADSVSGSTYTWDFKKDAPTEIKLQYVQYSGFAIAFVILLGILLLVYLTKKIIKHDSQKRIDNVDNIV